MTSLAARFRAVAAALFLAAALPGGAAADGPSTASIEDIAFARDGGGSSDYFYVKAIDGQPVDNLGNYSDKIARGAPYHRDVVDVVTIRNVSIAPHKITIATKNVSENVMPIFRMFGGTHEVSGDVTLTPVPGHAYRVKGEIGDHRATLWILDTTDYAAATAKIEVPL